MHFLRQNGVDTQSSRIQVLSGRREIAFPDTVVVFRIEKIFTTAAYATNNQRNESDNIVMFSHIPGILITMKYLLQKRMNAD